MRHKADYEVNKYQVRVLENGQSARKESEKIKVPFSCCTCASTVLCLSVRERERGRGKGEARGRGRGGTTFTRVQRIFTAVFTDKLQHNNAAFTLYTFYISRIQTDFIYLLYVMGPNECSVSRTWVRMYEHVRFRMLLNQVLTTNELHF